MVSVGEIDGGRVVDIVNADEVYCFVLNGYEALSFQIEFLL
jgi:hypothetical protein